jgi:hypothetical protein
VTVVDRWSRNRSRCLALHLAELDRVAAARAISTWATRGEKFVERDGQEQEGPEDDYKDGVVLDELPYVVEGRA